MGDPNKKMTLGAFLKNNRLGGCERWGWGGHLSGTEEYFLRYVELVLSTFFNYR